MAANSYSGFPYGDGTQYSTPAAAASVNPGAAPPFPYAAAAYPTAPYHATNPPPPPYSGYGYGRPMQPFNNPYDAAGAPQQTKVHYSAPPTRNLPQIARPNNHHPHHHRERQKMQPPRPKQVHYCEICKISCSCPRAYTEHLESKKHKKREAGLNAPAGSQPATGPNKYHCELCDVICTDKDAYAAHVRGSKHQKVVKLHTKLGKPIPEEDPSKFAKSDAKKSTGETAAEGGAAGTAGAAPAAVKEDDDAPEVKPVGAEYIEEIKEDGKVSMFNCKLCDCKFSDPNAKEMHMKGRRHRLQYKRKVKPDLVVDLKPTARQKRLALLQNDLWNMRRNPMDLGGGWPPRRGFNDFDMVGGPAPGMPPRAMNARGGGPPFMGWGGFAGIVPNVRPEGINDFYTIARHSEIYPKEKSLHNIHEIVSNTERVLRQVSDILAGFGDSPNNDQATDAGNEGESNNGMAKVSFQQAGDNGKVRVLQGVMRVGALAKGLLLQGDNSVQLVVLCAEKPKLALLERVASELTIQLKLLSTGNKTYLVSVGIDDGSISVTDGTMTVNISLTTPLFREEDVCRSGIVKQETDDEDEGFPREAALQALAELRHSKWFQAKAATLPSCVLVIRVMRDIRQRFPVWQAMSQWAIELLVEKVISSARFPLGPSDGLRRIMEAVSTGLLINGPGLIDPCEKERRDVIRNLTPQQREDITHCGQMFLRYIAFKQIYKILGMEQMSTSKLKWKFWLLNRKRACDDGDNEGETDGKLLKTTSD
ncbi:zinc finger RNA-binding protein-like [Eupeodes corollae]|uniref:zinc finger RNA-binding protein-like n=1 Tax=Eupeodes corollae TaxID=290404 RepID=UPI0024939B21|nr:zinc finger RNA-binding protein-like [Eupeodes corollae]